MLDIVCSYEWEPVPIHRILMNTRKPVLILENRLNKKHLIAKKPQYRIQVWNMIFLAKLAQMDILLLILYQIFMFSNKVNHAAG